MSAANGSGSMQSQHQHAKMIVTRQLKCQLPGHQPACLLVYVRSLQRPCSEAVGKLPALHAVHLASPMTLTSEYKAAAPRGAR